jgi:hypothetical protein
MVEDPARHGTLYAPTPQLAKFPTTTYRFDDFQVVPGDPAEERGSCLSAGAVVVAVDELDTRVVKKPSATPLAGPWCAGSSAGWCCIVAHLAHSPARKMGRPLPTLVGGEPP